MLYSHFPGHSISLTWSQLEKALTSKRKQVEDLTNSYTTVKDAHTATLATLTTAEELLQTLLTGLTSTGSGNSGGGGYMGQLADAEARVAQATAEEEQSRVKLGMSEKELKTLEGRWKEVEKEASEGKRNLEGMVVEVEKFRKRVADSGWSLEKEKEGELALKNAKAELRQLAEVSFSKRFF